MELEMDNPVYSNSPTLPEGGDDRVVMEKGEKGAPSRFKYFPSVSYFMSIFHSENNNYLLWTLNIHSSFKNTFIS